MDQPMNTHDIDIELPEPAFKAGTKFGTTTGFFCRDPKIKKGDGAYTRDQVIAAIEADRQRRGEPVAWAYKLTPTDGWTLTKDRPSGYQVMPLYTSPQPTEPVARVDLTIPSCEIQYLPGIESLPNGSLLYAAPQPAEPVNTLIDNQEPLGEEFQRVLDEHSWDLYVRTTEPVKAPSDELQGLSDRAYCQYIEQMRRHECLGWEQKVKDRRFGEAELKAHTKAGEFLGRHRAFSEAVALLARYGTNK